jgi:alanine dehydrogenase
LEATLITALRTGAAAGVASKYLAKADSKTLGLVGAGQQAHTQLLAHAEIFNLEQVKVYDVNRERANDFASSYLQFNVEFKPLEETVNSDVVSTITPVRKPIVKDRWIRQGTHINAVGADARGKQELEHAILKRSRIVVDNVDQALHSGEINVPIEQGLIGLEDIHSTLGELVIGSKSSRESDDEITVFDSTGLATQDLAVAKLVYDKTILKKV